MNCSIEGCTNKYKARGFCSTHLKQVYKHGKVIIQKAVHHNKTKTTEYKSWGQMKSRCYNTKHHAYSRYGGRGIEVSERWINSFTNFLEDMGKKPSKEHSLDRIDVNGNYEPDNCRWADYNEQAMNKRNSGKVPGVYFHKTGNYWMASLNYKGTRVLYTHCTDYDEAVRLRMEAEIKYLRGNPTLF